MMSNNKLKMIRACIATGLCMNVCAGIVIIALVLRTAGGGSSHLTSTAFRMTELQRQLDKICDITMREYHQRRNTHVASKAENNTQDPTLEFLSLLKPVVQLSGLNKGTGQSIQQHVVRNWAKSEGAERSYMWNGMNYSHGSISVPASGLYHVYSHVKLYVENNNTSVPIRQFTHGIVRNNADSGQQEVVASNVLSECKEGINGGAHLEYPSDVNTLVQLTAGDAISIKVTHSELLIHDIDWHNFGAYLI